MSRRPRDSDPERERTIIAGALLWGAAALDEAEVRPDDFDDLRYRTIVSAMQDIVAEGRQVDLVEVGARLRDRGEHKIAGDLAELVNYGSATSSRHLRQHAARLRELSTARRVREGLERVAEITDPDEMLAAARTRIPEMIDGRDAGPTPLVEVVQATRRTIKAATEGKQVVVPTGLRALDRLLDGGLRPHDLIVVAARPSMGKTALMVTWAVHAVQAGIPVYLASLEMSAVQLMQRMAARLGLVPFRHIRLGNLTEAEARRVDEALERIVAAPLVIDDDVRNLSEIRARARRFRRRHAGPRAWIGIDYLQLLENDVTNADNREQEVAGVSRGLKLLAREVDAPVVLLAQLNRGPELRASKRPLLADLRESGAIEQDADVAIFPFRAEHYPELRNDRNKGLAELLVLKQRNGELGDVPFIFRGETVGFFDLHKEPGA